MNRFLTILLLICNTAVAQVDLALGLRAYYPFNGNSNDASGNNNNTSFNNATPSTDRFGNANSAYQFNGINNYIQIPNSSSLNQANLISFCAWVKVTGFYQGVCHGNSILAKGNDNQPAGNYILRFDDNAYTNSQNCSNPIPDIIHQNFYGTNTSMPGSAYTPYIQTGQWYSLVYTYDGATVKMYVNCELKASKPSVGFNFTNSADLFFGKMDLPAFPYWFNGTMDEIRIYNRVLNIDEIKAYGDCSSLTTGTNIGGIINTYTPVIALNPCENKITVEDAITFNAGDTVLMIQMKGAVSDSTNTAAFGTVTDYKNAGTYEINYVKSKAGNIIELKNTITRQYDLPDGKVQLVRIPYYTNANITYTLTCLPWDGNKGGVLVLNARDTINLNSNIDVSGKGFRGGNDPVTNPSVYFCYENNFFYPVNPNLASEKGEGIALISSSKSYGKGAVANGGGGGNSHNSGGAGGGNTGAGGFGGYNFEGAPCNTTVPFDNRGISGKLLTYSNAINKVFMGGGGGAGHTNNFEAFQAKGGNGSGIAIIIAGKLIANSNKIIAAGADGLPCPGGGTGCHEGMGGGGAGGSVLMDVNVYVDNTTIETIGGKGADMTNSGNLKVGPGGGGGGGILWLDAATLPANITFTSIGGLNGICTAYSNNPWGATAGANGTSLLNLQIPIDNIPFKPNIDSVRIKDSLLACDNFDFKGLGYTNTNAIANWQWYFGDGGTAITQNTNHTYATGSYTVKLVVTDINGCKDSVSRNVTASLLTMDAGPNDTICNNNSALLQATANGATQYAWTPAAFLNNATILNPTATPPATTMFYLTATNAAGCIKKDSALVTVRSANAFNIMQPSNICTTKTVQLNASGGDIYAWQPAATLNNPSVFNPTASPTATTTYSVQITDTLCNNTSTLSTTVTVIPLPNITANKSNDVDCSTTQSQLTASGGSQYSWTPAATLNNPAIANPIAAPAVTTQYVVTGTDATGCINYDTVIVNVSNVNKGGYLMPTGFTPNNDGLNDCYGIKSWGAILDLEFSIYNRWGERVFYTRNPSGCWDGRYKGLHQDGNVFVYMIKAKTVCEGSVFRKGTFVLIR
ncbi:MAG: LamG-like jellyroll fold domain-containing protein [Bacteroidota bacterium]|nr:LamG-like jellyroll fold domain-containing protein [Bacteroidota bacterium]